MLLVITHNNGSKVASLRSCKSSPAYIHSEFYATPSKGYFAGADKNEAVLHS